MLKIKIQKATLSVLFFMSILGMGQMAIAGPCPVGIAGTTRQVITDLNQISNHTIMGTSGDDYIWIELTNQLRAGVIVDLKSGGTDTVCVRGHIALSVSGGTNIYAYYVDSLNVNSTQNKPVNIVAVNARSIYTGDGNDVIQVVIKEDSSISNTEISSMGGADQITVTNYRKDGISISIDAGSGDDVVKVLTDEPTTRTVVIGGPGFDTIETGAGRDLIFASNVKYTNYQHREVRFDQFNALSRAIIFMEPEELVPGAKPDTNDETGDIVDSNGGDDIIYSASGFDLIHAGSGSDIVHAGSGRDRLWGGSGNDILYGEGSDDDVYGENGDDLMDGGSGNDLMKGGKGDDQIYGGSGSDVIYGNENNDLINGGSSDDWCSGDAGDDTLSSCNE